MNLKLIKYLALICLISVQAGQSGSINQELKTKNNYTYNDVLSRYKYIFGSMC